MEARLRALPREDRLRRVRVLASEGDVGLSRLCILDQMCGRIDDVSLSTDRARVVHHAKAALDQPVCEVEILVTITAASGESFVEPTKPLEHVAPNRELPVYHLIELRHVIGFGHSTRLRVGPCGHSVGEQSGWRLRM
jgi:hypothetical protein